LQTDLFRQKLALYQLSDYLPDYRGPNDFASTTEYLSKSFAQVYSQKKPLIMHLTCATGEPRPAFNSFFCADHFLPYRHCPDSSRPLCGAGTDHLLEPRQLRFDVSVLFSPSHSVDFLFLSVLVYPSVPSVFAILVSSIPFRFSQHRLQAITSEERKEKKRTKTTAQYSFSSIYKTPSLQPIQPIRRQTPDRRRPVMVE
jgi:hypothetical protein